MLTTHNHSLFSVTVLVLDPHKFSQDFQSMLQCFTKPSVPCHLRGLQGAANSFRRKSIAFAAVRNQRLASERRGWCKFAHGWPCLKDLKADFLSLESEETGYAYRYTRGLCYSRVFQHLWGKHKRKITLTYSSQAYISWKYLEVISPISHPFAHIHNSTPLKTLQGTMLCAAQQAHTTGSQMICQT